MPFDKDFLRSVSHRRPESEADVVPHLRAQSIEHAWALGGMVLSLYAEYAHTHNSYCCFETLYRQGGGPPPARRLEEHLFLIVLDGEVQVNVGSQSFRASGDSAVFVPRGYVYWFTALTETAKVLYMLSSADTFAPRSVAEIEVARRFGQTPRYLALPSTSDAPDPAQVVAVAREHGVEHPGLAERGLRADRRFGLSNDERIRVKRPESERDITPFVNSRSADNSVWYIGQLISFYIRGTDTGGVACVFEGCPPRGFAPPPHIHLHEHETFFLRSGSIIASCAGTEVSAQAPALLFLPRGLVHTFESTADDTKMLSWTNPTDSKRKLYTADVRIFELLGEPAGDLATPPAPTAMPDFETAIKIGLENGIVFPGLADPGAQGWEVGGGGSF